MRFHDHTDVVVVVVVVESSIAWDIRNMFVNMIVMTQRIELQFSNVIFIIFVLMILLSALSHRFVSLVNTSGKTVLFFLVWSMQRTFLESELAPFA